ncbi:hypothetical protein C1645_819242, partial [Glomus cerebriforme]
MRVRPVDATEREIKLRDEFSVTLAEILTSIKAIDLIPIMIDIGAKSVYIPRTPNNMYSQKPYANFYFPSAELRDAAEERTIGWEGRSLRWNDWNEHPKLCHACGKFDHIRKA